METTKKIAQEENIDTHDVGSLKGALFSSIVFVGGGIVSFILLLFITYMVRI
ncbi:hypothetical protein [Oceanobacillus saliphilus]|uniref:hypothetical protein n=1 Tax=Oceanobacillus saliphilus TaxID=2925834 RepID=UPI00201DBFA3|nr:hypothetical protein [Oceanobacillus saliphilus]